MWYISLYFYILPKWDNFCKNAVLYRIDSNMINYSLVVHEYITRHDLKSWMMTMDICTDHHLRVWNWMAQTTSRTLYHMLKTKWSAITIHSEKRNILCVVVKIYSFDIFSMFTTVNFINCRYFIPFSIIENISLFSFHRKM